MEDDADPAPLRPVLLERVEGGRNVFRFYALWVAPTLFGDVALVREWGRIGSRGRRTIALHADPAAASAARSAWLSRKLARGYLRRG